jgi:hypothetical protein
MFAILLSERTNSNADSNHWLNWTRAILTAPASLASQQPAGTGGSRVGRAAHACSRAAEHCAEQYYIKAGSILQTSATVRETVCRLFVRVVCRTFGRNMSRSLVYVSRVCTAHATANTYSSGSFRRLLCGELRRPNWASIGSMFMHSFVPVIRQFITELALT